MQFSARYGDHAGKHAGRGGNDDRYDRLNRCGNLHGDGPGTSASLFRTKTVSLTVTVPVGASNDFQLAATHAFPSGIAAGAQAQAKVSVTSNYAGSVMASCDASAISGQCLITPINPVATSAKAPASLAITLNVPNSITPGAYSINLAVVDSTGQPSRTLAVAAHGDPGFLGYLGDSQPDSERRPDDQRSLPTYSCPESGGLVVRWRSDTFLSHRSSRGSPVRICPGRPGYAREYLGGGSDDHLHHGTQSIAAIASQSLDLLRALLAAAGNRDRLECGWNSLREAAGPHVRRYDAATADLVVALLRRCQ